MSKSERGDKEQLDFDSDDDEAVEVDVPERESVKDSALRAFEELEKGANDENEETSAAEDEPRDDDKKDSKPEPQAPRGEAKTSEKPSRKDDKKEVEDIPPPGGFNVQEKEVFNALPIEQKKAFKRIVQAQEDKFRQTQTEFNHAIREAQGTMEAIKPYLRKWGMKGYTADRAIAELAAAQDFILESPKEAILWLAKQQGVDLAELASGGSEKPSVYHDPRVDQLTTRIAQLDSERAEQEARVFEQTAQSIAAELSEVKEEKDASGKYRFPKTHDDAFLKSVEPLMVALRRSAPNLSWGDALRKAYLTLEGDSNGVSAPRLPANNSDAVARAKAASVSVRSRGAAVTPEREISTKDIPRDARGTVKMVMEMLENGS